MPFSNQNIHYKHKLAQGFTLIELLLVTIIVGLLSATALPSYLNQAGKARGSEAKSTLGTINRAQQTYRFENFTFANNLSNLDTKIKGKFYSYNVSSSNSDTASHQSTPLFRDLKQYSSWVEQNGADYVQVICESNNTGMNISSQMNASTCPIAYKLIK